MSVKAPEAMLVEQATHQTDRADYDNAWETYREFRESLDDGECTAGTLRVLNEAERTAEESFRAGRVGFESDMNTLLYIARRAMVEAGSTP